MNLQFFCSFICSFISHFICPFVPLLSFNAFVRSSYCWLDPWLVLFLPFRSVLFTGAHSFTSEVSTKLLHCISVANSDDIEYYFLTYFSDKHFWTQGFVMVGRDKLDCVPLFLGELADDIFVCGKTINLLKLCCPQVCLF